MRVILFLLLFTGVCYGANISQPPPVREKRTEESQFLKNVSDNFNNLTIVTTNPNGNRKGKNGDVVLYKNGAIYYVATCISSPSGTSWVGVLLGAIP